MIAPVNLENSNKPSTPEILSDDDLRVVLEAAEHRKENNLRSKSRTVSIIVIVPVLILAGWAAIFLIQHQINTPPVPEKPASRAPEPLHDANHKTDATLDTFRPEYLRANQPAQPGQKPKPAGKIVDQDDIRFANELLNFGSAASPQPVKH